MERVHQVRQKAEILDTKDELIHQLHLCEQMGRVSHKSEGSNYEKFLTTWWFHENLWENGIIHLRFLTSIAIGRELLRHRMMSPIQESTRYVDQSDFLYITDLNDYNVECSPIFEQYNDVYSKLVAKGVPLEDARDVLPLATASTICVTMNFRELRTIFRQRFLNKHAHPMIRELIGMIWNNPVLPDIITVGLLTETILK